MSPVTGPETKCSYSQPDLQNAFTTADHLHRLVELVGPLAFNSDPLAAPALVERLRDLERRLPDEAGPAVRRSIAAAAAVLQLRQAVAEALLPYPVLTPGSGRAPGRSGGETHQEGQKRPMPMPLSQATCCVRTPNSSTPPNSPRWQERTTGHVRPTGGFRPGRWSPT